jgi:hypothetical protein
LPVNRGLFKNHVFSDKNEKTGISHDKIRIQSWTGTTRCQPPAEPLVLMERKRSVYEDLILPAESFNPDDKKIMKEK